MAEQLRHLLRHRASSLEAQGLVGRLDGGREREPIVESPSSSLIRAILSATVSSAGASCLSSSALSSRSMPTVSTPLARSAAAHLFSRRLARKLSIGSSSPAPAQQDWMD